MQTHFSLKKIFAAALFVFGSLSMAQAQEYMAVYGGFGSSFFSGDVGQGLSTAAPQISMGVRQRIDSKFSVRGELKLFQLTGEDTWKERGADFVTDNAELSAAIVYDFVKYNYRGKSYRQRSGHYGSGIYQKKLVPYVALGLGMNFFNPKDKATKTPLRSLKTEGVEYKSFTPVFVGGGGFRFNKSANLAISVEGGVRLAASDYLDDVSTSYARNYVETSDTYEMAFRGTGGWNKDGSAYFKPGSKRGNAALSDIYGFITINIEYNIARVNNRFVYPRR